MSGDCPIKQKFVFTRERINTRLFTSRNRTFLGVTPKDCKKYCVQAPGCESFNTQAVHNLCELNMDNISVTKSKSVNLEQFTRVVLMSEKGWKYQEKKYLKVSSL